jgi:FlaA1/EpsC-like NDP-sugar epimerase
MLRLLGGDHDGGLFALAAGETVEVRELAERLLLVHGLVASRDIRIIATARPDTKASLALWGRGESCGREAVRGALSITQKTQLRSRLDAAVDAVLQALRDADHSEVDKALRLIDEIAPEEDRAAAVA